MNFIKTFFDISIGKNAAGRLIFEIYSQKCPRTAHNFISLCKGFTDQQGKFLHYKNSTFHRIIPFLMCQSGDILTHDGKSNISIYGGLFEKEKTAISHDRRGILSMVNDKENKTGGQFFITFQNCDWLDDTNTAFGKLIEGDAILNMIEYVGSTNGTPKERVLINNCGVLH